MSFSPLSLTFSIVPRLSLRLVMRMADTGVSIAARHRGTTIDQLRANMARLTGSEPSVHEVRDVVRSHTRDYTEQLMLGSCRGEPLLKGVPFEGFEALATASKDRSAVLALGHSGSWNHAGAWACTHGRGIVTVAEKVEPPAPPERFVLLHEGLGMEIIGVVKGESVFSAFIKRVRGRSVVVPLLADRDISGSGTEVDLGTRRVPVVADPATLAAKLERLLSAACITYKNETPIGVDVRVCCVEPINMDGQEHPDSNRIEALTQAQVDEFVVTMATKAQDWRMMQRVYVEDLNPERLVRARAEHKREN